MENKWNVGEPVAVYAWVDSINMHNGTLVYSLKIETKDGNQFVDLVAEDSITTVF